MLAGNQRIELRRQLAYVEHDIRLALVRAWLGGVRNKHVLAEAAQIDVRTVYSWLNVEGLNTGRMIRHADRMARHSILGLDASEISRIERELSDASHDRDLSDTL